MDVGFRAPGKPATASAITEGIAPQTIKKVMRWSTTRMLDRYAHPDQADVRAAIDTIGAGSTAGSSAGSVPVVANRPEQALPVVCR